MRDRVTIDADVPPGDSSFAWSRRSWRTSAENIVRRLRLPGSASNEGRDHASIPLAALLLLMVCFALGQAVQFANGALEESAIRWLAYAGAAALLVPLFGGFRSAGSYVEPTMLAVTGAMLARQFMQLFSSSPGLYLTNMGVVGTNGFYGSLAAAAVLAGLGLSARPSLGRLGPIALVCSFLIVGRWMLAASPTPYVDVFLFQRDGAAALWNGHNPYTIRYPDIYGGLPYYGPGLSVQGQLQFGYPYYPLSLLLVLPAHVLAGDFRWAQLIATAFVGLVIMLVRPSPLARAAGALFLFTPRTLFVLEQGWIEPLVLALLALVALTAEKKSALLPWTLGLLIASKQYTIFMVPLAFLLLPREQRTWRGVIAFALKAALPALLVTLPFVIMSPKDFWFDVVKLQVLQPFRPDSLSFLAWWFVKYGKQLSLIWPFAATLAVVALSLWRLPRNAAGFVAAIASSYLVFFALNKQAFCNYYYLIIGAAALGVALYAPRETSVAAG